jgi:hypothetical protein
MHPSMKNTPGVLDFTTFLSTDLNILVMGDSVGIQISQTMEEMLGGKPENRKVYRYCRPKVKREALHISAPPCTMGGRLFAGLACVLGCVYNNDNIDSVFLSERCQPSSSKSATLDHGKDIWNCAHACNERYLSLTSVDNEVVD